MGTNVVEPAQKAPHACTASLEAAGGQGESDDCDSCDKPRETRVGKTH